MSVSRKLSARDRYLRRTYGISQAQYEILFRAQHRCCAVCGTAPKAGRFLHVDHSHRSGSVRGLLCFRCNKFVVSRHHDSKLLHAAACYLDNPPALRLDIGQVP